MISVIIPVYNRSHIIENTLISLTKQTYKDFEVVIVDDCSNDSATLEVILNQYSNQLNIIYIRHETNKHGSAARNTGIMHAKGKYIAFLDSDDIWRSDKLSLCMMQNIDKKTILYSKVKDRNIISPKKGVHPQQNVGDYLIINSGTIQTSSIFMHLSFCKSILFDEKLVRYQDYDFIIRSQLYHNANFKFIDEVLVFMTDNDSGSRISNSLSYEPGLVWIKKNLLSPKAKSIFVFNRLVNYCICLGKKKKAMSLIIKYNCLRYIFSCNYKVMIKLAIPYSILKKFMRIEK